MEIESKVFEQLFEEIVARCLEAGLIQRDNLSVGRQLRRG